MRLSLVRATSAIAGTLLFCWFREHGLRFAFAPNAGRLFDLHDCKFAESGVRLQDAAVFVLDAEPRMAHFYKGTT